MQKAKNLSKKVLFLLAIIILMLALISPIAIQAGVPASDVIYTVTDLKVTSSPVEEENNFTVQATYHAKITNYGWTSSVWHQLYTIIT